MIKDKLRVECSHGFHYDINIEFYPEHGFTHAIYMGTIIDTCELNKIREPVTDDDFLWELYEERLSEWKDEMLSNLKIACKRFVDNL